MAYNYFVFEHLYCLESNRDQSGNLIISLSCHGRYIHVKVSKGRGMGYNDTRAGDHQLFRREFPTLLQVLNYPLSFWLRTKLGKCRISTLCGVYITGASLAYHVHRDEAGTSVGRKAEQGREKGSSTGTRPHFCGFAKGISSHVCRL